VFRKEGRATMQPSSLPTVEGMEYVVSEMRYGGTLDGGETSWDPSADELDRGESGVSSPSLVGGSTYRGFCQIMISLSFTAGYIHHCNHLYALIYAQIRPGFKHQEK
jgi:hypothetical protein